MKKQIIIAILLFTVFALAELQSNAQDSEQMTTAIKLEPGVLSYTAIADKKDATSITILEVYASNEAYQSHILTTHFRKYKDAVKDMVLALELIDTNLVCSAKKDNY